MHAKLLVTAVKINMCLFILPHVFLTLVKYYCPICGFNNYYEVVLQFPILFLLQNFETTALLIFLQII